MERLFTAIPQENGCFNFGPNHLGKAVLKYGPHRPKDHYYLLFVGIIALRFLQIEDTSLLESQDGKKRKLEAAYGRGMEKARQTGAFDQIGERERNLCCGYLRLVIQQESEVG